MYISRLALDHFRSWNQVVVDFTPGVNVLYGANGLGKTNLVEAVEVLSTGGSHRVNSSLPLVERGYGKATIRVNANTAETTTYEVTIAARGANRARVNSGPSQYLRDVVGLVPSVSFTPEDQRLVSADPATRRGFLNQSAGMLIPGYTGRLQRFTQIARQRAALLKQLGQHEGSADAVLSGLEVWTGQFIEAGVALTRMRNEVTHPKELRIDCFLFRDAMILKLQEKVAPSENSFVASGGTHCFFVHTTHQIFLDFSCQTRRQGNDTFMIFFQDFHIHTRFIIETFCKTF